MTPAAPDGGALADHAVGFVRALRRAGVPVSVAESIDAVGALALVPLVDRDATRAALAAATVKRGAHRQAFDALFDLWFPAVVGEPEALRTADRSTGSEPGPGDEVPPGAGVLPGAQGSPGGGGGQVTTDDLRDRLRTAIADGDDAALRSLAREAVARLGRSDAPAGRQSYFAYRVQRELSPRTLVAGLLETVLGPAPARRGGLDEAVARAAIGERIRSFEQHVDAEVRRRLAEERSTDAAERAVVKPLLDQVDFLRASRTDLDDLRRAVTPLARRLATRLAARRRSGRDGRLDVRRTVRASMGSGGVPVDVRMRAKRPHKPELVLLCDVSGSVASFAHFTLMLTWTLREQFTKVRSFAFIDTCDEVTRHFELAADLPEALDRMARGARLVWFDGHSDYGHSLEVFAEQYADAITPRTSLLVLGDARTNYRSPALPVLKGLVREARHAYWLNPEPRGQWGSGDSAAPAYADVVPMLECRNVAQLEAFVTRVLPGAGRSAG